MKRVIITGAPGTGKTTLLGELSRRFEVADEVSRALIRSHQTRGLNVSPWGDVEAFAELALKRMIQQCRQQRSACCIFDRSIPDLIVALRHRKRNVAPEFPRAVKKWLTGSVVFFAPTWREIYVTDAQRPHRFEQTLPLSELTKEVYLDLGFELIELKKVNPAMRAEQVSRVISEKTHETDNAHLRELILP